MNRENPALGATVTRISLGLVLIAHSVWLKGVVFTLPGTAQYFASIGLPAALAYIVFVIEAVAGVALVLGFQSRAAAMAVVPVLLGASWAHRSNGWLFTNPGGECFRPARTGQCVHSGPAAHAGRRSRRNVIHTERHRAVADRGSHGHFSAALSQ